MTRKQVEGGCPPPLHLFSGDLCLSLSSYLRTFVAKIVQANFSAHKGYNIANAHPILRKRWNFPQTPVVLPLDQSILGSSGPWII